jgi:hypothetical protein
MRRFPPPWMIDEHQESFIVREATGQALGYFYFEEEFGRRSVAKLLTDEARRIAANIAKLPELRTKTGGHWGPSHNRRRSRLSRHDQQPPQLATSSMDGCVEDQDYNDCAQNDHPIRKLNARYRCLFAKPFHDYPPILKQRLTKGRNATESSRPRIVYV